MKRLLDLPELTIQELKKLALKAQARSVKNYMENVLIDHAKKK